MDWNANERLSRAIYRILRAFALALAAIPLPVGQRLGRAIGRVFALVPMGRTLVSLEALRETFGKAVSERELRSLNRAVIIHFGQMLFEVPHVFRLTRENLERYVVFENEENYFNAAAKGRGVFMLTAHFGNWELMAAAVVLRLGVRAAVIVRPIDFPPADRLVADIRTRFGTEIIPKKRSMRRVMELMKKGGVVGILLDQNVDWYDGVFVPFLGRPACTNKGLALLALRTEAPVVPVFSVRGSDGRYRIVFEPEVPLVRTGDKTMDVEESTAAFTQAIEAYVRRHPDHWFWFHKRWKTKPYCEMDKKKNRKKVRSAEKLEIRNTKHEIRNNIQ